jgi:Uma2 family endonuclease
MALPRALTVADLYAMPESERGERHELIDGDLLVNPAPNPIHQIVSGNLMLQLELHVRAGKLGRVIAAPGLHVDERTYVVPDIVFIAGSHIANIGPANVEAAPDLICEILSPGTRRYDQMVKRSLYARIGVREYWLVDPGTRSVTVLVIAGNGYTELAFDAPGIVASRVLPGLRLKLEDILRMSISCCPEIVPRRDSSRLQLIADPLPDCLISLIQHADR